MRITFTETPVFTKRVTSRLSDAALGELQRALTADPLAGDVIQGTGGVRKVRWADAARAKGKRGGVRVIYYYVSEDGEILLLTIYGKDEADDLTADERKAIREYVENEKADRAKVRARK